MTFSKGQVVKYKTKAGKMIYVTIKWIGDTQWGKRALIQGNWKGSPEWWCDVSFLSPTNKGKGTTYTSNRSKFSPRKPIQQQQTKEEDTEEPGEYEEYDETVPY